MFRSLLPAAMAVVLASPALAQQAPWAGADIPISSRDRVYAAEQFSNTVSVVDPHDNRLLGEIKLGDPQPQNFSPLYRGQVLVHGLGAAPDGKTIAVVSIGSNGVTFIDTATNAIKHTIYVGRSPHEAFFTPDGREVWVTVRGENYVSVLDPRSFNEISRIITPGGPGMTIFSTDAKYAFICSSFNPELVVVEVASHKIAGHVTQPSPFCPNIAATPDGKQVWFTLKDVGKTVAISAVPPFGILKVLETGPITNHVNFAHTARGQFAYVTVGGLNLVKVFRTDDFNQVASVPVGKMPHGVWPSGDGSRIYVGLENDDALEAIDTSTNRVTGRIPIGQAPQAIAYVPRAVALDASAPNLEPLGAIGQAVHLTLASPLIPGASPTSATLFDQGLIQVVQAAVTGLEPKKPYVLGLAGNPKGLGAIEQLAKFTTNPAGAAIVNTSGPIRQLVEDQHQQGGRRWLVIVRQNDDGSTTVMQVQTS